MSANINPTAPVYDVAPARLFQLVERQSNVEPSADIMASLADGIEAIHQLANIAGYSKRARDLVFAVASRAYNRESASVELTDEELAELQGCSAKTVQRQRADYLREARRLKTVDLVGIEEGEYDRSTERYAPTLYSFHLGGTVAAVVAEARRHPQWQDFDRKRQCEEIGRAAAALYNDIPEARPKGRKRRRPRKASKEVETHWKAARTHLRKLRQIADRLPAAERAQLFAGLWPEWVEERAEMDRTCNVDSPQATDTSQVDEGGTICPRRRERADILSRR
jgi:hypothetical protein